MRGDKNGSRLHPERVPRGELHHKAKLTASKVSQMRAIHESGGISHTQLAAQFGVTRGLVGFIIKREIWKHVP